MIKAKSIILERGEGPRGTCNIPVEVKTFTEADRILAGWAHTAPENGGYDKCFFAVTYEDGYEYLGRYDLKHINLETPSLADSIRTSCKWTAGRAKNPYCGMEKYKRAVESCGEKIVKAAITFLDNYQIGDNGGSEPEFRQSNPSR